MLAILSLIGCNSLGYEKLRWLALNFASTHQAEKSQGFLEVGDNKEILIAIVVLSLFAQFS